ncbi:hypothetical protein ACLQ2Q_12165 [Microbacterium sp. DT81.1]|uniref:hypothetical protein n=1 Tax=Microbacterium sp. DT81.1 TaxID=3393413 RepID=UPI003CFB8EB8
MDDWAAVSWALVPIPVVVAVFGFVYASTLRREESRAAARSGLHADLRTASAARAAAGSPDL